ncbi:MULTISPECIES: dihydrodipicolinate synthase family protein [Streptomyces]|uniref:Dihydrodipicolinate synthase n=1 Tax=Streptomyces albus (strain ATCC 21838 / DSM 41398 / FERM P-419 / JCM 4703 / NBRC 107858) TaxID=1081613 RepID=A0A0B5ESF6_STRA4|nr:dihydrodipicolinate synthase family protein [Streptomyces sp. SCSIO ZS0520]AJE85728.1 dihydrodipicolinate synthase [Streptomyces albus]AOU80030.1 dihydrodipicolinate synthase [Streptomyces albus]
MSLPPLLTGVVPPVCTPLTPDLEVDTASLTRLVDHLVAGGVDGLFVLGSSSEAAYLPDGHRRRVVETVVAHVGGQLPVLAGAIDMTALRVLDHAHTARAAGADGIVVTAPFYTRTHPAEIVRHYQVVAERAQLPVLAYDLPVSVHSKLDARLVLELAAQGVLAGLKDSSGDEAGLRRVLMGRRALPGPPSFSVLTGSELTVDSAFAMGADGVVPGLGNVDPHGYVRLARLCRAGDWAGARTEQERLAALFRIVDEGDPARIGASSSGLGAFKAALHLRGVIDCPVTAAPQLPLTEDEVKRIGKHLASAGLL